MRTAKGVRMRSLVLLRGTRYLRHVADKGTHIMFTGIVTDVGKVTKLTPQGDLRARIGTAYDMATVDMGASIACDGCCLTVVDKGDGWFDVDISAESLSKTTLGQWAEGQAVNLERALKFGDELGGHIVSGHVDGVATESACLTKVIAPGSSSRHQQRSPNSLLQRVGCPEWNVPDRERSRR